MRLTGFKYLWVDALCIVQGPRGDWTTESAKMADVYGGAFLTISAAISLDVQHGFQESLTEHFRSLKKRKLHPTFNPLYGRGWALQERILSPRVLIFGKGGMFWECREYASLSYMQGKSFPYIPRDRCLRLKQACGYEDWMTIVEDYTKRSLSINGTLFPRSRAAPCCITNLQSTTILPGCGNNLFSLNCYGKRTFLRIARLCSHRST